MDEQVLVEQAQGVMTLRLNRPDKMNALTRSMYSRLAQLLREAQADRAVRVVVITGSTECFTSGNDIVDFLQEPPSGIDSPVFQFMRALFDFDKPVIAAVAGAAVGIGTTLLLHCDLVYISRDAKLRTPFVNLGLCPEFGSSLLLSRLVGPLRATELLLLGEGFSGEQAQQWGLANAAFDSGAEAYAKAHEMALRFTELAPSALRDSKRLMRAPDRETLWQVIEQEAALFVQRLHAPEAVEALSAFTQRRKPDFAQFA